MLIESTHMTCPGCGSDNLTAYYRCTKCGNADVPNPFGTSATEWSVTPVQGEPNPKDPNTSIPARQKCPGCGAPTDAHALVCNECDYSQTY